MSGHDAELVQLKAAVSCALLLERGGYSLDLNDSTKHCLKYRRGAGEVVIVNHGGQGWWDPMSDAKGDVFILVQHLNPGLNFGQVCKHLRGLVGMAPSYPEAERMREPPRRRPKSRRHRQLGSGYGSAGGFGADQRHTALKKQSSSGAHTCAGLHS